jgi:hypothetical protein
MGLFAFEDVHVFSGLVSVLFWICAAVGYIRQDMLVSTSYWEELGEICA